MAAGPAITLQARLLYLEDLATNNAFSQTTDTILGLGAGITVTPLLVAANDAAAAAAGLPVGGVYVKTTGAAFPYLATRMT